MTPDDGQGRKPKPKQGRDTFAPLVFSILERQPMTKRKHALVSAQPLGRIIRRSELAELGGHSTDWVDRAARQKNSLLVAIRSPKGYIMGFTEASVRKFLKCPTKGVK